MENSRLKGRVIALEKQILLSQTAVPNTTVEDVACQKEESRHLQKQVNELRKCNQEYREMLALFVDQFDDLSGVESSTSATVDDVGDEEVDSIIIHAEHLYGRRLCRELVDAWKAVSVEGEILRKGDVGADLEPAMNDNSGGNFSDLPSLQSY